MEYKKGGDGSTDILALGTVNPHAQISVDLFNETSIFCKKNF